MFVKNLTPGQQFVRPESLGTVYTVESVRTDDRNTVVEYNINGTWPSSYVTSPLATVMVITD